MERRLGSSCEGFVCGYEAKGAGAMMRCGGGKGRCKADGRSWLSSDDTCERRDEKGH